MVQVLRTLYDTHFMIYKIPEWGLISIASNKIRGHKILIKKNHDVVQLKHND